MSDLDDRGDDDQGDDGNIPYQDSYQQAERDAAVAWDGLRDAARNLKEAADLIRQSSQAASARMGELTESMLAATPRALLAPGRPLDPDARIRWQVSGYPVVLGDGRPWALAAHVYRDNPVWDVLVASMTEHGMLPASAVVEAAALLLFANYDVAPDEAIQLLMPIDLHAVLLPVMSTMERTLVVPVGNRPLIFDDAPEEDDGIDPDFGTDN